MGLGKSIGNGPHANMVVLVGPEDQGGSEGPYPPIEWPVFASFEDIKSQLDLGVCQLSQIWTWQSIPGINGGNQLTHGLKNTDVIGYAIAPEVMELAEFEDEEDEE